jgi:hypothetical protein
MWANNDYSTKTSICGLFLDVTTLFMFGFVNFIFPFSFAGHYFAFPNFSFYVTSLLPAKLGKSIVIYLGHGVGVYCGCIVMANAMLVSAILTELYIGNKN